MAETLKEIESTENPSPDKALNPTVKLPRNRLRLILAGLAAVASLALVILAGLWYLAGPGPVSGPNVPARLTSAASDLNPTPAPVGFGISANGVASPTPAAPGDEPARLRGLADDFLNQGRPVEAAAQYRLILDKFAQSPVAQPALYGLAKASVQRQRWNEAADAFKKYVATYPKDGLIVNCYFYLGMVDKQLGFWDEAVAYFQKYQAVQPGQMPLDGYAYAQIAEAYNNTLKPDKAIEAYKQAGNSQSSNLLKVDSLEKVGDYYLKNNNPAEAINFYNKVLEISRLPEYRADITAKLAHAYDAAGQTDKAAEMTRQLVFEYVDTASGSATLRTLYNNKSPLLDDYFRGYYALRSGNNDAAITAIDLYLKRPDDKAAQPATPPGLSPDAQNRLARGWFYLANAYENKGELDRAGSEYRDLLARFPQGPTAPDCLLRLAKLAQRQNAPDNALSFYDQLIERFPSDPQAETAAYAEVQIGIAKGPDAAAPYVNKLRQKWPGTAGRSQAYYNLAQAYQTANNQAAARAALQQAANSPQVDFFTIRAGEQLQAGIDANKPPRSNPATHPAVYSPRSFADELETDRATLENWLPGWASQVYTPTATLEVARTNLNKDPGLKRLIALKAVGEDDAASREAKETFDRFNNQPQELYLLSLALSQQSEFYFSIASAKRVLNLYQQKNPNVGLRSVPLLLQKLIYPLPFQSIILEQSRQEDFDPLLLVATLKQESAFDQTAHSGAGAMGLSQIMPDTGRAIANNLDTPNFKLSDLYLPYTAIQFGAFYLSARLKDFDGNPYQALAAYNAGAGNVYRWNKAVPPDQSFDKWLASIDYPETRNYVEIIYANYAMYRQIYAAPTR